jgi:hypothetical protein
MPKQYFPLDAAFDVYVHDERPPGVGEPEIERRSYPWSGEPDAFFYQGRKLEMGDRFKRSAEILGPDGVTVVRQAGDWVWWRAQGDPSPLGETIKVNPDRDPSSEPGSPMKDKNGIPIFVRGVDGNRERPTQPLPGEQARDPWTGELLFDENNDVILVPDPVV